jgi:hypothetical protein
VFSETSTYSSELTTNHPTWNASSSKEPVFYYEAIHLNITYLGYISVTSDVNICGFLYEDAFNPDIPNQDLEIKNCDNDINKPFSFMFKAKPTHYYILIVTSRGRYETKSFTITVNSVLGVITFQRLTAKIITTTTTPSTTTASEYPHITDWIN